MTRIASALPFTLALAVALAAASCATTADVAEQEDGPLRIEGTVASIDLQPWSYDGNAIVQVETERRGIVQVQLPAHWSLCKAEPVDVEGLVVGMRVQAVGAASGEGGLVVCADPSHRLVPLE